MRKRDYMNTNREKWIMVGAAAVVLSVLTAMGLMMRETSEDKVIIDFTALEETNRELAQQAEEYEKNQEFTIGEWQNNTITSKEDNSLEANSGTVTIPALEIESTDVENVEDEEELEWNSSQEQIASLEVQEEDSDSIVEEVQETSAFTGVTFGSGDTLQWPIVGNVLLNYSMDKTIYFPTLKQYKYNSGIVIQAVEGEVVTSASAGMVEDVYYDAVTGHTVLVKMNDTYSVLYGQLSNIAIEKGSYLDKGMIIGEVASPTKYFSVEGCNVYFELRESGVAINPLSKLE
ncbi:MAG: M23 family metallopeptidase [Eubacteriales bacterium]